MSSESEHGSFVRYGACGHTAGSAGRCGATDGTGTGPDTADEPWTPSSTFLFANLNLSAVHRYGISELAASTPTTSGRRGLQEIMDADGSSACVSLEQFRLGSKTDPADARVEQCRRMKSGRQ